MCKDSENIYNHTTTPIQPIILQSGDYNLCKYLRKCNYFREKSEKKRNFLPKYFADTENCRIFAVHLGNKDA